MPKINVLVISPPDLYALRNLEPLRAVADISISNDEAELEKLAPAAEVILFSGLLVKTVRFREVWKHASNVRWVHSLSAGVEKLLIPELIESEVPLTNARGVFKRSLAEFAVLGMLYHYKRVRRLVESQRKHHWDDFKVRFLQDRVMGVVGYGEIGRECALLANAMGVKIHAVRRNPAKSKDDPILERVFKTEDLHEMLKEIDVLLCAAPLTPETHHMISDSEFEVMKRDSLVINVGRGPVIEGAALIRALEAKKIAGAAMDVFEAEPLAEKSPLWDMENVLISPHCADRTEDPDWLDLTVQFFVRNFGHYQRGEALENVVDKKAGY